MFSKNELGENCLTLRQQQIYNTFRRLWTEHVMWTRSFIISTAFNLGDLDAVTNDFYATRLILQTYSGRFMGIKLR